MYPKRKAEDMFDTFKEWISGFLGGDANPLENVQQQAEDAQQSFTEDPVGQAQDVLGQNNQSEE